MIFDLDETILPPVIKLIIHEGREIIEAQVQIGSTYAGTLVCAPQVRRALAEKNRKLLYQKDVPERRLWDGCEVWPNLTLNLEGFEANINKLLKRYEFKVSFESDLIPGNDAQCPF